jgi:hypothetical protein
MSTIVILAGRRIDAENASIERFPRRMVANVAKSIRDTLTECSAICLVCSAAAGADLLALDTALDIGIRCRVVIFSSVEEFGRASVSDRGPEWEAMYTRVIRAVGSCNLVCVPAGSDDASSFRQVNERLFEEAFAEKESQNVTDEVSVAVWDQRRKSEPDFTAEYIDIAKKYGIKLISITTIDH